MRWRWLIFAFRLAIAVGLTLGLLFAVDGGREYGGRTVVLLTAGAGCLGGFFFLVNEVSWLRSFQPDEPPYLPVETFSMSSGALGLGLTYLAFKGWEAAAAPHLDALPAISGTALYAVFAAALGSILGGLAGAGMED